MKKTALYTMTSCALMAAMMCALCPLSVPIGPIPVSLGTFVMMLTVYLLGTRNALISCAVYLLLGAVGMPVFSGFQGGLAKLAGPTGGYLIGYLGLIAAAGVLVIQIALLNVDLYKQSGNLLDVFNIKAIILAAVLLVLTRWLKPTKNLHPIIFIVASAVVGILIF